MHIGAQCLGYIKRDFLPQTATYLICGIVCTATKFRYATPQYYDIIEFDFIDSGAQIFSQITVVLFALEHVKFEF